MLRYFLQCLVHRKYLETFRTLLYDVSVSMFNVPKLLVRRYMAEILPIWRKTLSNQSINVIIFRSCVYLFEMFCKCFCYTLGVFVNRSIVIENFMVCVWCSYFLLFYTSFHHKHMSHLATDSRSQDRDIPIFLYIQMIFFFYQKSRLPACFC